MKSVIGFHVTVIFMLIIFSVFPAIAQSGCISECRDDYESEVEDCKLLHDNPDDADMLSMCIDNAKSEYDDCVEECQSDAAI